jgi:3-deoxy-D-manno-octulosonic-acid transferase
MVRESFDAFSLVLAQSPADAKRLAALGVRMQALSVSGNLKFDIVPDPRLIKLGQAWRNDIGNRPVWVAASTRPGEEIILLRAFLEGAYANQALLVLVPRHPQRFDEVAMLLASRECRFIRRSAWASAQGHAHEPEPLSSEIQVLLVDTMGELTACYAAADFAVIGGSLLPFGGQNLIEACTLGKPVLIGEHTFNFAQASEDAICAGAAQRIANVVDWREAIERWCADTVLRATMSEAAQRFAMRHRGATQRTLAQLKRLLEDKLLSTI